MPRERSTRGQPAGSAVEPEDLDVTTAALRARLLSWFDQRRRALPWRAPRGQLADPYAVWVSEVMLQQTRVEVVYDYFLRWMHRFPTLRDLANASEDEVLELWQGLGYYARARRLLEGAKWVVRESRGELPLGAEKLQLVPGVGPYSAGAIASIAQGQRAPLVDGNVVRVLTRLYALEGDPGKNPLKRELWRLAARLVPAERPGDFNQSLMELGATVCTPRKPACHECPVSRACGALASGAPTRFPELPPKAAPTPLRAVAVVARAGEEIALVQQAPDARWWASLWTLPYVVFADEWSDPAAFAATHAQEIALNLGLGGVNLSPLPPLVHPITRFRVELRPFVAEVTGRPELAGQAVWRAPADVRRIGLPSPHRKVLSLLALRGLE